MTKWSKDDWCFFEFNLVQIQEVKEGRVTSVSDGSFNTGGWDLSDRCLPLTLRTSAISDTLEYWSNRLHKEGNNALNYPDIHRKLVDLWYEWCLTEAKSDAAHTAADRVRDFAEGILRRVKQDQSEEIEGVRLL